MAFIEFVIGLFITDPQIRINLTASHGDITWLDAAGNRITPEEAEILSETQASNAIIATRSYRNIRTKHGADFDTIRFTYPDLPTDIAFNGGVVYGSTFPTMIYLGAEMRVKFNASPDAYATLALYYGESFAVPKWQFPIYEAGGNADFTTPLPPEIVEDIFFTVATTSYDLFQVSFFVGADNLVLEDLYFEIYVQEIV